MKKVGMVGIGMMGHGIATNVQKAGYPLSVLDHPGNQPLDTLVARGVNVVGALDQLVTDSDVLIFCVTGSAQLEDLFFQENGVLDALAPGTVVIDCSTAIPSSTQRIAQRVMDKGGHYLDAPMTRTPKEAATGTLNLLVGGDKQVYDAMRPLLDSFAETVTHVGEAGAGHRMKLLHNYVSLGTLALLSEAAMCASQSGLDSSVLVDVLQHGGGGGAALERLKPWLLEDDPSALRFTLANAAKDLRYYATMADEIGSEHVIADAILTTYTQAAEQAPERYVPEVSAVLGRETKSQVSARQDTAQQPDSDALSNVCWFATDKLFINGDWRNAASMRTIPIGNPSTDECLGHLARGDKPDVEAAVTSARGALNGPWGKMTAAERGQVLMRMAGLVRQRSSELAMIEALDVGKPLHQSQNDVAALARYLEFYAGAADKLMGNTIPYQDGFTVYTLREPHGVVGIITPWNYPMQIAGRAVGGALAAGNSCVVKPAEDASVSTLAFAAIAQEAGLPAGALNVVTGLGVEAGGALSEHKEIDFLSFTGSVGTGAMIQGAAARNVIPVTLELGGKSPHIVFDDADLDEAMPTLVGACMQNAGQTCSAASRVLVQRGMYEEVKRRMVDIYQGLVAGPAVDACDLGPLVSKKQKDIVTRYIELGKRELTVAAQGTIHANAPKQGHFVPATLFSEVPPDHALAQEEIFGPVQVLMPFADEAEALQLANGTPYGLVAGVWTSNGARQMRLARKLNVGQVFINNYGAGGGIELPFGGVGLSGHGREKGFDALYGFTRLKTVAARHG